MLVGMRLGLKIEGCHFPGHFLARIEEAGKKVFVDCFNGGQIIDENDLLNIREGTLKGMKSILSEPVDANSIVRCYLANLIHAYKVREDEENCRLFIELFREMDLQVEKKIVSELTPEDIIHHAKPLFTAGQRVHHTRYGYRGIIVDVNPDCRATDEWYYGNQTQPKRNQPWYHILVHGSDQVTYVAQSHLVEDKSNGRVKHPLLSYFFKKDKDGCYVRNDHPWPETDF
jgi:heat shock protein HspQ